MPGCVSTSQCETGSVSDVGPAHSSSFKLLTVSCSLGTGTPPRLGSEGKREALRWREILDLGDDKQGRDEVR